MKAPELPTKIYFTILDMGSGYVYTLSLDDNGGTEYIRKDTLIGWVNEKLEGLKALLDTDPYKEAYVGQCEVYKELIDKLNSM